MHLAHMRSKRFLVILVGAVTIIGCSSSNWDWGRWRGADKKQPVKPVARADRAPEPATAQAKTKSSAKPSAPSPAEDARAGEVDNMVQQYVRSMEPGQDGGYTPNDFNAKIQRQQDPNRRRRIHAVAERTITADSETAEPGRQPPVGAARTGAPNAPQLPPETPTVRPAVDQQTPIAGDVAAEAPTRSIRGEEPGPAGMQRPRVEPTAGRTAGDRSPTPAEVSPRAAPRPADETGGTLSGATAGPLSSPVESTSPRAAHQADHGVGLLGSRTGVTREATTPPASPAAAADSTSGERTTSEESPGPQTGAPPTSPAGEAQLRPPVLDPVIQVSGGSESESRTQEKTEAAGSSTPQHPAPTAPPADTLNQRIEELRARVAKDPNSIEDQFDLRMLYLAGGQEDKALATIEGTDAETQRVIEAHMRTLMTARNAAARDPALAANEELGKIEELRDIIRARADLQVPKVVLCTAIEGFGWYTPIEPPEFKTGRKNPILVYVEVDNFRSEKTASGMHRSLLSVRQTLLSKAGQQLWEAHDPNIEDMARRPRRDFFLSLGPWTIPPTLAPGEYVLKVEVEDVLAGKINSNVATFKMAP